MASEGATGAGSVSAYCAGCGAPVSQDAAFCPSCGARVAAPVAQSAPLPPSAPSGQDVAGVRVEQPVASSNAIPPRKRRNVGLLVGLVLAAAALLAAGCYFWIFTGHGGGQDETLASFRAVMEKQGWESVESTAGYWLAASKYKLAGDGFAQLIEYRTEDAAHAAQAARSKLFANYPGFQETSSGFTTLYGGDQIPGWGSVEMQLGNYRFESYGKRVAIDALVTSLGYLDPSRSRTDPIAEFRAAVKESDITTSTDSGYSERSAFRNGDFNAERKSFYTLEDAQADYALNLSSCEAVDLDHGTSSKGSARILWFITYYPDSSGKSISQYAMRAYNGMTMTAVSGPVEDRSTIESIMKELGY